MNTEFLKKLKVGDEVILNPASFGSHPHISKVEKITPTRRLRVEGLLFNPDGHQVGEGWHKKAYLEEATEEARAKIRRDFRIRKLKSYNFARLTNAELDTVWDVLKAVKAREVAAQSQQNTEVELNEP